MATWIKRQLLDDTLIRVGQAMDDLSGLNNLAQDTLKLAQEHNPKSSSKWRWRSSIRSSDLDATCDHPEPASDELPALIKLWRTPIAQVPFLEPPQARKMPETDERVIAITSMANAGSRAPTGTLDHWIIQKTQSKTPVMTERAQFGLKRSSSEDRSESKPKKRTFGLTLDKPNGSTAQAPVATPNPNSGIRPKFGISRGGSESNQATGHPGGFQGFTNFARPSINPKETDDSDSVAANPFKTAHEQLVVNYQRQGKAPPNLSKKSLGVAKPSGYGSFRSPMMGSGGGNHGTAVAPDKSSSTAETEPTDDRYRNIDPKMVELIENEIMDSGSLVAWEDIAGLDFVKTTVKEIVVFPMLRPDIFRGLRAPPKGLLLFGPPGTGKTLIGKCIASQSNSTFFSISASSLTSKWVGEGEKMVRALFAVARVRQPSVVFIDEIDSLLTQRSDTDHESSRRIKTEFLVQLDGATTEGDERILVVGATNRPQELDEAARRRLVKRLYVPLPEGEARRHIIQRLMEKEKHEMNPEETDSIVQATEGYSGADMSSLCKDAAMGPIRSLDYSKIELINTMDVRPISVGDFRDALRQVKASVSDRDLALYLDWNDKYGSGK